MLILNDLHAGVQRKAGTTPTSQEALRGFLFDSINAILGASDEAHLLVLGDLFDDFVVPPRDWVDTFMLLSRWASAKQLTLVAGNHDLVARGNQVSSFEMLCTVLKQEYPDKVQVVDINEYAAVAPGVIALAHCGNQDLFDAKIKEIVEAEVTPDWLLIHANFDNNFAVNSDHSLNVSEEQGKAMGARGIHPVFAHEHQARKILMAKGSVLGNQIPTSCADCLGNDEKFAHILNDEGLQRVTTWSKDADNGYAEINWRELGDYMGPAGFIRIAGDARGSEAADVINAIAKFRGRSEAFVITNATKIDGVAQTEDLPESFEAVKTFDVVAFIHKNLDERERKAFDTLLEKSQ